MRFVKGTVTKVVRFEEYTLIPILLSQQLTIISSDGF